MSEILFVASEVAPFAKTGGLADVAGALPKALAAAGHQARIFMPLYRGVAEQFKPKKDQTLSVRFRGQDRQATIWKTTLPGSAVPVHFLDEPAYYHRPGLYQEHGKDYTDNAERFAFFSLAALEWARTLPSPPAVIHCHDWQAALVPVYLKTRFADDRALRETGTILTIHNIAYQGTFPRETLAAVDLPESLFTIDGVEFWGQVSFLKGGIQFADAVNTVSRRYAEEIRTSPEFGRGLEGVLAARGDAVTGITNGLDYDEWNPATDPLIPVRFGPDSLPKKQEMKQALLKECGLSLPAEQPLVGSISRLDDQKGWDLVAEAMPELLKLGVGFVILGTGDPKYHTLLEDLRKQYPAQLAVFLKFDNPLAHRIYAGSDLFLMPSRFEPCGLGQLISMKYGTIPVVRETGGLADTVRDAVRDKKGNGFSFADYSAAALVKTVKRAVTGYNGKRNWELLMKRAMKEDWSWSASARAYLRLYEEARARRVPAPSAAACS